MLCGKLAVTIPEPVKLSAPTAVSVCGNVNEESADVSANARLPIDVSALEACTVVSELQFSNKPELILVIACGNVADVRLVQPENALAPRYVTKLKKLRCNFGMRRPQ